MSMKPKSEKLYEEEGSIESPEQMKATFQRYLNTLSEFDKTRDTAFVVSCVGHVKENDETVAVSAMIAGPREFIGAGLGNLLTNAVKQDPKLAMPLIAITLSAALDAIPEEELRPLLENITEKTMNDLRERVANGEGDNSDNDLESFKPSSKTMH